MTRVYLIGKEARLDCIAESLLRSGRPVQLYTLSEVNNPGLLEKSVELKNARQTTPRWLQPMLARFDQISQ